MVNNLIITVIVRRRKIIKLYLNDWFHFLASLYILMQYF